jgi:hypothetical protein
MTMLPFSAYGVVKEDDTDIPVQIVGVAAGDDGDYVFVCLDDAADGWCMIETYESVRLIDKAQYDFKRAALREAAAKAAEKAAD